MQGYIEFDEGTSRGVFSQRRILGGTFLTLRLGCGGIFAGRRAARAARQMREQGVRTAVFPLDFPLTTVFERQGITPVDPLPLRRAVSAVLVRRQLEKLGCDPAQAVVAVVGDYLTREMEQTVKTLALHYRYVMLSASSGAEELARSLRREYGISLLLRPSRDQLERADALLLFVPRPDLHGENAVLCALYPGGEVGRGRVAVHLSDEAAAVLPSNCCQEQFAAALHSMGAASEQILNGEIFC